MYIKEIKEKEEIIVAMPLTKGTEKTRIKKRSIFNEYGIPVATRSELFSHACYVEWQIGYDVVKSDLEKLEKSTLKDFSFVGANGKEKTLYELSEYVKYFYDWDIVKEDDLLNIKNYLNNLNDHCLLDSHPDLTIKRSHPIERRINDMDFSYSKVEYPILVHKFGRYEIITEIIIKEKQYAIGTQPMLYLCFPIKELKDYDKLLDRVAEKNEYANFSINKENIYIFVEMLKIFGTLSLSHKKDVISIIDTILA